MEKNEQGLIHTEVPTRDKSGRFIKGSAGHLGFKHSDESKRKMGESRIGQVGYWAGKKRDDPEYIEKISTAHLGQVAWNKGKSVPAISGEKNYNWKGGIPKCKICNKQLAAYKATFCTKHAPRLFVPEARRGEQNWNWKGGITPINKVIRHSKEYKNWRSEVFKRDNYQCILGGKEHGSKLNADHIKPFAFYPDLRFVLENGRTLCELCHQKTTGWGYHKKETILV